VPQMVSYISACAWAVIIMEPTRRDLQDSQIRISTRHCDDLLARLQKHCIHATLWHPAATGNEDTGQVCVCLLIALQAHNNIWERAWLQQ
jgi:hypothetical protein